MFLKRICPILVGLVVISSLWAQAPDLPQQSAGLDGAQVIAYIKDTIAWHGQLAAQRQLATDTSDLDFLNDHRQYADRVLQLSFDFGKAAGDVLAKKKSVESTAPQGATQRFQNMSRLIAKADDQIKQNQQELERLRQQLANSSAQKRQMLLASIQEVQSEIDLATARRDVLRSMVTFASEANAGAGDLRSQIDELQREVPVTTVQNETTARTASAPPVTESHRYGAAGIISLSSDIFALNRKVRSLNFAVDRTSTLSDKSKSLRSPVVKILKALSTRGDELAQRPDNASSAEMAQRRADIESLTQNFKQLSSIVVPLAKQSVLLDLDRRTLESWRDSTKTQYTEALRTLAVRLILLAVAIILVLIMSRLWRRAILRYVQDVRRQHQMLLVQRFVFWFAIAIIAAFAFSTELGSLATFAGLITAGLAVALQNVIQSIVGYFFLIGRYGVRPGDRVQIAGITGEVVDIGLVRFHLMEIAGEGQRPTGRIVVFSNSIIFQPNASFFRQIPGTNFVWHEIKITLAKDTDFRLVDERLMPVVLEAFENYREKIEQQRNLMQRAVKPASVGSLMPQSRLVLTGTGLEVVIRYPVELSIATEIDEGITRGLLAQIEAEPRFRLIGSATPSIQTVQPEVQPAK